MSKMTDSSTELNSLNPSTAPLPHLWRVAGNLVTHAQLHMDQ